MIPESALRLVPETSPEVPAWVQRFAEQAEFLPSERQAYLWAVYLLQRLSDQAINTAITGLIAGNSIRAFQVTDVSSGFIPLPRDSESDITLQCRAARFGDDVKSVDAEGVRYAFGVIVGIEALTRGPVENLTQTVTLAAGMPLLVEIRTVIEQTPPNPCGVSSACFARPRASKRFFGPAWSDGIITARHVLKGLGFAYGTVVPMASGSSCPVVDIDGATTIDATILDCGVFTASALKLATIAPFSTVEVDTVINTPFKAQVLRIYEDPHYFGNIMSHRTFLDTSGASGDSGSLVKRATHGDAVGIYVGSTKSAGGEGIVQCMRQVVEYFEVDIFL